MSSLPLIEEGTESAEVADILTVVEKKFGFVPNLIKVFASSPSALKAYLSLSQLFENSLFSPEEQQLVLLTVSRKNQCGYCLAVHSMIASKMTDLDTETVTAARHGQPLTNQKHQSLMSFVSDLVENRGFVQPEAVERFKGAGYSDQHVLDVLVAVSMKTLSNYTNHIAKTPIDEQFSDFA